MSKLRILGILLVIIGGLYLSIGMLTAVVHEQVVYAVTYGTPVIVIGGVVISWSEK